MIKLLCHFFNIQDEIYIFLNSRELEDRIKTVEGDNSKKYDEIKTLESNLGLSKAESRQYQAELTVINQLFSEILLGFKSSQDIDLDKLQKHLEDHRDLLQNIVVNEISPEVSSALPKVLLELLTQVDEDQEIKEDDQVAEDGKLETIKEESGEYICFIIIVCFFMLGGFN